MKVKPRSLSPGHWQLEHPLPSHLLPPLSSLPTVKGFTVNLWNIIVLTNTVQNQLRTAEFTNLILNHPYMHFLIPGFQTDKDDVFKTHSRLGEYYLIVFLNCCLNLWFPSIYVAAKYARNSNVLIKVMIQSRCPCGGAVEEKLGAFPPLGSSLPSLCPHDPRGDNCSNS